jgi:hypothetical protein
MMIAIKGRGNTAVNQGMSVIKTFATAWMMSVIRLTNMKKVFANLKLKNIVMVPSLGETGDTKNIDVASNFIIIRSEE